MQRGIHSIIGMLMLLAFCAVIEAAPREVPSRQNAFSIPFRIPPTAPGQAAPKEVQLFCSQDKGASWELKGTAEPNAQSFAFRAPRDGEYWFSLRTVHQDGKVFPAGPHTAQLHVTVDTHKPRLDLAASRAADGGVLIQWQAVDEILDLQSLKIETSTDDGMNWRPIAIASPPQAYRHTRSGHATFWPPAGSRSVRVRAEVFDLAKNQSVSQSSVTLNGAIAQANTGASLPGLAQPSNSHPTMGNFTRAPRPSPQTGQMISHPMAGNLQGGNRQARNRGQIAPGTPWPSSRSNTPLFGQNPLGSRQPTEELPAPRPDALSAAPKNPYTTPPLRGPQPVRPPHSNAAQSYQQAQARGAQAFQQNQPRGTVISQPHLQNSPRGQFSNNSPAGTMFPGNPNPQGRLPENRPMTIESPFYNPSNNQRTAPSGTSSSMGNSFPTPGQSNQPVTQAIQRVNSGTFDLDYNIESIGPSGVAKVELWTTRDGGKTWSSYGEDQDHRSPFRVNVMQEGIYGFRVVVEAANGLGSRHPASGDLPDVQIGVDMTKPAAQITSVRQGQGNQRDHLIVQWQATDALLADRPVSLFYSATSEGPWATVAASLQNTGEYAWRLPREIPDQFYLKFNVRDAADNRESFTTPQPTILNRPRPQGHIRGVRPVVKSAFLGGPSTQ